MENEFGQILMQEQMAMFEAFSRIAQVVFSLEIIALLALLLIALFLSKTEEKQADSGLALQMSGARRGKLVWARIALAVAAVLVVLPLIV
jgi:hypothetical protein